ncbi:hypothetical protein V8E55_004227 [Tylopilus felleus]
MGVISLTISFEPTGFCLLSRRMSRGPPSMYIHHQAELHVSRDAVRDRPGRPAPIPAPFWTVPSSEIDSVYAHPPCVRGEAIARHASAGMVSSPSVLQRHGSAHAGSHARFAVPVAAAPFAGPAAVYQFDCSRPGTNLFLAGADQRGQSLGNAIAATYDTAESFTLGFTPAHLTWEQMARTGLAPRTHAMLPPQGRSWEPTEPTCKHPPFPTNEIFSVEPAPPQNAEDDDDKCIFVCEWTDEHGTCNMDVIGERVWMSHHLSRRHNVVGHEKAQRACLWRGCTDTMNKGSLARHVVSRHLRAGASCGFCSKVYSRADVARRHTRKCKVANGAAVQREETSGERADECVWTRR